MPTTKTRLITDTEECKVRQLILKFLQLIFSKIRKWLIFLKKCFAKIIRTLCLWRRLHFFSFPNYFKFYERVTPSIWGLKHVIKVAGRRFKIHRVCNCFTFRHELKRLWWITVLEILRVSILKSSFFVQKTLSKSPTPLLQ